MLEMGGVGSNTVLRLLSKREIQENLIRNYVRCRCSWQ